MFYRLWTRPSAPHGAPHALDYMIGRASAMVCTVRNGLEHLQRPPPFQHAPVVVTAMHMQQTPFIHDFMIIADCMQKVDKVAMLQE